MVCAQLLLLLCQESVAYIGKLWIQGTETWSKIKQTESHQFTWSCTLQRGLRLWRVSRSAWCRRLLDISPQRHLALGQQIQVTPVRRILGTLQSWYKLKYNPFLTGIMPSPLILARIWCWSSTCSLCQLLKDPQTMDHWLSTPIWVSPDWLSTPLCLNQSSPWQGTSPSSEVPHSAPREKSGSSKMPSYLLLCRIVRVRNR